MTKTTYMLPAVLILLLLCCGCGLFGQGLEERSADYYSFMAGSKTGSPTDFYSPAYRKQLGKQGQQAINDALGGAKQAGGRYPECTADDVAVSEEGKFAYTMVNPKLGDAYANLEPVRWVKVGSQWYVYNNTDIESQNYGMFPAGLQPIRYKPKPGEEGAMQPTGGSMIDDGQSEKEGGSDEGADASGSAEGGQGADGEHSDDGGGK